MTTLHYVKKARKSIPGTDIKKGDSYYWWQFAFSSKQVSKRRPRRSQYATRSEHLGAIYDIEDNISEMSTSDIDSTCLDEITNEIESIRDTCQERLDNMPEQLQEAPAGQTLQDYIDNLESWVDDIEDVDLSELDEDFVEKAKEDIAEDDFINEDGVANLQGYEDAINERAQELEEEAKQNILDELQSKMYPG